MYDSGETADRLPYICMELVNGRSLASLRDENLGLDFIARTGVQVLSALAYSHGQGIVHRDVKPENIIICDDLTGKDMAKLLDFGFARIGEEDSALTETDAFGTPLYMAPELVAQDGQVGPACDIYSVGVILYELLCGRTPFQGTHGMAVAIMHLMEPVPPMTTRQGHSIPIGLETIVMRALAKKPRDRFRSATDMARSLASHAGVADTGLDLPSLRGEKDSISTALAHVLGGLDEDGPKASIGTSGPSRKIVGRRDEQAWLWSHASRIEQFGRGLFYS